MNIATLLKKKMAIYLSFYYFCIRECSTSFKVSSVPLPIIPYPTCLCLFTLASIFMAY